MRISIFIILVTFGLSACVQSGPNPESQKFVPVEYSTTQSGSPAARYCVQAGGVVSYGVNPDIPTMDMIYCTPQGGEKMDAWKYMDIHTSHTGAMMR